MKELKDLLKLENLVIMGCQEYPCDPSLIQYWGGQGEVVKAVSERIVHKGFEVLVLPRRVLEYSARGVQFFEKNGVHILSLPIERFKGGMDNSDLYNVYPIPEGVTALDHCYTSWRYLQKMGMENHPILHAHDWLSAGWVREAKRNGLRTVFTVHMSSERNGIRVQDKRLELENLAGKYSDIIHFISLAQCKSCKVYDWNSGKKRIVIPNGVDIHKFKLPEDTPIDDYILFVGRLTPVKNVPNLIKGWSIFNKNFPEVGLKILGGSGLSNTDVVHTIETLDFNQRSKVELKIELVKETEKIKYFQNSSVCCFPSLEEAFGIVALEAQACSKPVIVGDVGGFKENVLEGVTGTHVTGTAQSIAEGLELAYKNRKVWGKNARKLVETFYSWDEIVEDYVEELYLGNPKGEC